MKATLLIVFTIILFASSSAQAGLNGTWQGVMTRTGAPIEKGTILYADFSINDGILSGKMRDELNGTTYYALKTIKGTSVSNEITFEQLVMERSQKSSRQKWCRMKGSLTYDPSTGYLKGKYQSVDCKRVMGEIILYRSNFELATHDEQTLTHSWFNSFVREFKAGLPAPEIREQERKNFQFEPVFFDFDKSEIRANHHEFLDRLIRVVKGHSDLRVRVTGHTDNFGTDGYNDGLSKRRAEAIIKYFVDAGLSADRLVFDFHGEKKPAATNDTADGRQRNRRVDFEFVYQ